MPKLFAARCQTSLWGSAFLILCLGSAASAQQPAVWPIARGPASVPKTVEYSQALVEDLPIDWLIEYPAICLYSGLTSTVSADGTVEDVCHGLCRLNNQAAVEQQGECRLYFQPEFQTVTINEARVHTAEGKIVQLRPEHVQVRDGNTDYQIYATTKEVVLSFPGLGVGDVVELQWTLKGRDPEYAPYYAIEHYFNDMEADATDFGETHRCPIRKADLVVRLPRGMTLQHTWVGQPLVPKISEDKETRTYAWAAADLLPPPVAEPAARTEEFLVGVTASTFPSWEAVGKWELDLRKTCRECTPELREKIKELTAGARTTEEKVRSLVRWVRSQMRYLSQGHGLYGNRPHDPAYVIANRFGDCKDKTQLLSVMLTELGVPHESVLVMTAGSPPMQASVPSPSADHIFLKIDIDGKAHYVDPTDTWNAWNLMRSDCYGRPAFLFSDKTAHPEVLPEMSADDWRIDTQSELLVNARGEARLAVKRQYHRLAAGDLRAQWMSLPVSRRRERLAREFSGHYTRASVSDLVVDERKLADPDEPLEVRFNVDLPAVFEAEQNATSLAARLYDTLQWDLLLSMRPEVDRQVPLYLTQTFHTTHRMRVALPLPLEFTVIPENSTHDAKWGQSSLEVTQGEDLHELTLVWDTRVNSREVTVQDLPEWLDFDEAVSTAYSPAIGVDMTTNEADIERLTKHLKTRAQDGPAWESLVNLLIRYNRKDEARKTLEQALAKLPDARPLALLALDLADTLQDEAKARFKLHITWPHEDEYRLSLANTLIDLEELNAAEKLLDVKALSDAETWKAGTLVYLAKIRLHQKKTADAATLLEHALEANAGIESALAYVQVRGQLLEQQQAFSDAEQLYSAGLGLFTDDPELLAGLIRTYRELKDRGKALRSLWVYASVVTSARHLAQAAQFNIDFERWEDAEILAKEALEVDANLVAAQDILKSVQARAKKTGTAGD